VLALSRPHTHSHVPGGGIRPVERSAFVRAVLVCTGERGQLRCGGVAGRYSAGALCVIPRFQFSGGGQYLGISGCGTCCRQIHLLLTCL
jgi:hypothetical protein